MTGNYFGGIKLGKQLAEKAREVAQEREEASSRLAAVEKRIELASSLGLATDLHKTRLQKARQSFEEREYRNCIASCIQAMDAIGADINKMFATRIESTSNMMNFLAGRGSETSSLQKSLEKVHGLLNEEKFEEAESALSGIWQKEEKTLAEVFSHEFSAVQRALNEAKTNGVEVEGVEQALSEARNEITANNFESAFRLLEKGSDIIGGQMRARADESLQNLTEKIELSRQFGLSIEQYGDRLEQLRKIPADKKLGEMRQLLNSMGSDIDKRLKRSFEMRLKTVRGDLHDRTLPSSFTSASSQTLKEIEGQLERDDFTAAFNGLSHLEAEVEKAKYDYIARILFNGKKYITVALKSGIDLAPVNDHLNEVRELMKKRRYHDAIDAAEKANKEAMRLSTMTTDAEDTMKKLDAGFKALVSLVTNSVDISIRYSDVKRKYESKDLDAFFPDARLLLKDMDALLENLATGQIDALDRSITALEYLGAETLEINKKLGSAVSLVKNREFAASLDITTSLDREMEAKLKELRQIWSARARRAVDTSPPSTAQRLEKLMSSVSDLESKGEDFRAASLSKDVVDWASSGDVQRIQALIERSRRLLKAVPDVSSASAVNMLDAAERGAGSDTESALRSAGEAHDMLYTLLNDYFVKEMGELMEMVSTCRRKRVEIGYGYTLISRARAALKFEDFEDAARMVSVAGLEIKHRLKQVEDIERDFERANALLSDAGKVSGDTNAIEEPLSAAGESLKRYDYSQARKEISEALMLEEKSMASMLAAKEIVDVKALLSVAAEAGVPQGQMEAKKEEMLSLMRERRHYEALSAARSLSSEVTSLLETALGDMIDEIAGESSKAELDGLDTSVVESRLEKSRNFRAAGQFSQCMNSLKLARDELELVKNSVEEAIGAIEKADGVSLKLDELGLYDAGAFGLLKQAKNLLKNDQHLLAIQTAGKCLEAYGTILRSKGRKLLEKYSSSVYSSVGKDELDAAREAVNAATSALGGDPQEAVDALVSLKNLSERASLQEEMAKRTFELLKKRSDTLIDNGIVSGALHSEMSSIGSLLGTRSYKSVIQKGIEVEQMIAELSSNTEKAKEKMSLLEDKLASYEGMGLPIDECKTMAKNALELISSGKTADGVATIAQCESRVESMLHEACISRVASLDAASRIALRLGLPVGSEQTGSYNDMIAAGDTAGVFALASKRYDDVASKITGALRGRLDSCLGAASLPQSHASAVVKEFEKFISMQRFDDALIFVKKTEDDARSKSIISAEFNKLTALFMEVSADLRKIGIGLKAFDQRFKNSTREMTAESIESLRALVEEMGRLKADYSPKLYMELVTSDSSPRLKVSNSGKVVALGCSLSIKSASIVNVETLGNLKPGESRTVNLPSLSAGEVSLNLSATSPVDGKELSFSRTFAVDARSIRSVFSCSACRGKIREGSSVLECSCGRAYHEQCAKRTAVCDCGSSLAD